LPWTKQPFGIIPHRPNEEPLICLSVNKYWVAGLLGMLYPYRYPEAWLGTLEENRQARQDVMTILDMLIEAGECDMSDCNCVVTVIIQHRVNPITLQLEISIDNGETWLPDPESYQNTGIQQPPLVTSGSGTKCDAATNGKVHIEDFIAAASDNLATAGSVFEFAVAVMGVVLGIMLFFISGGTLSTVAVEIITTAVGLIWGIAQAAFTLGQTAFDDYWTSDERDKILCALYCTIGDDGAFTDQQYANFISKWDSLATPSVAYNMVKQATLAGGKIGLNNICSYGGAAESDCSDCDCEVCDLEQWQFIDGEHGMNLVTGHDENGYFVQADSTVAGGVGPYVILQTPTVNDCCYKLSSVVTNAPDPNAVAGFYVLCGLARTEINKHPLPGGGCVNLLQAQGPGGTSFTVRWYLSACP
jgi:hypothetical protein